MDRKRFASDLADALKITWDFNEVFSVGPAKRREADLPYAKGRIRHALVYLNAAIHTEQTRKAIGDLFPTKDLDLYYSEEFSAGLLHQLLALPEFLPEAEADFRDHVDRPLGRRLGQDGLYAPQSEADQKAHIERMLAHPIGKAEFDQWMQLQRRIQDESNALLAEARAFTAF